MAIELYDKTDKWSIFEYSKGLIGHSLRDLVSEDELKNSHLKGQGKGGLEHMLEALYFKYPINSDPGPDFKEAGVELKGTGLKILKSTGEYTIKERLVCDMVDYCQVVLQDFEESAFFMKCRLMLLVFYLYEKGVDKLDLKFIYTVLWQLPEKDLMIMRNDYYSIINKIKSGNAHNLSEGDTEYLAVCRKGQKGDKPRRQPYSDIPAVGRAFSLKPSYMRTILAYIKNQNDSAVSNLDLVSSEQSLVSADQLRCKSFEDILLDRFTPYIGKTVKEIMENFIHDPNLNAKDINYRAGCLIASQGRCDGLGMNKIERTEEFRKSGIVMKTIPTYANGNIKESMSFRNIDYEEIYSNDQWIDSEAYEIFTGRFLMVQFKHPTINSGAFGEHAKELVLEKVFFWTMPQEDLAIAEKFWEDIRLNVRNNEIELDKFWSIKKHSKFHVRPKGTKTSYKNAAINPNGGMANKYCYWMNSEYVRTIVDAN